MERVRLVGRRIPSDSSLARTAATASRKRRHRHTTTTRMMARWHFRVLAKVLPPFSSTPAPLLYTYKRHAFETTYQHTIIVNMIPHCSFSLHKPSLNTLASITRASTMTRATPAQSLRLVKAPLLLSQHHHHHRKISSLKEGLLVPVNLPAKYPSLQLLLAYPSRLYPLLRRDIDLLLSLSRKSCRRPRSPNISALLIPLFFAILNLPSNCVLLRL